MCVRYRLPFAAKRKPFGVPSRHPSTAAAVGRR